MPKVWAYVFLLTGAVAVLPAQTVPPLDALMRGGRIHYSGGRFDRALEQFTRAFDAYGGQVDNPARAEIRIWLGLCEAQRHNNAAAAAHFHQALTADSASAQKIRADEEWQYWAWTALVNSARQFYAGGAYDSSLSYALEALKVDPSKPGTYTLVANSYSAQGRYEEMLATARQLLEVDKESPDGLGLVGLYFLEKPDSLWPEALKTGRWDSCGHYYDQAIQAYTNRYEKAKTDLGQLLKLSDPKRIDEVSLSLVERSRVGNQEELKRYIEQDLNAKNSLAQVAQMASQLFYAANNLNVSSSRCGSGMLRAASETAGDTAVRFRARAEALFSKAIEYDPLDFTARFNLGIAQYQSQKDTLAERSFREVVAGAVFPVRELTAELQNQLLALLTGETAKPGFLSVSGPLLGSLDSLLDTRGYKGGGYGWLYFPGLKSGADFTPPGPEQTAGMFLSLLAPGMLENAYLLLGVSQTSVGMSLKRAGQNDAATAKFNEAISNLDLTAKINPQSADAYQNLGHCYRETGQTDKAAAAFKRYEELSR